MNDAAASMEMKLRVSYEKATQKYSNDYQQILWACADGHELRRRSIDVFESYVRVTKLLKETCLNRPKFNSRLNSLKQSSHGNILTASRQGQLYG